jgi:hypothetical protein
MGPPEEQDLEMLVWGAFVDGLHIALGHWQGTWNLKHWLPWKAFTPSFFFFFLFLFSFLFCFFFFSLFLVLGTELRALHLPGKRSSTLLNPQPLFSSFLRPLLRHGLVIFTRCLACGEGIQGIELSPYCLLALFLSCAQLPLEEIILRRVSG